MLGADLRRFADGVRLGPSSIAELPAEMSPPARPAVGAILAATVRVGILTKATPEHAVAACDALARLQRTEASETLLLFWTPPPESVDVRRLWDGDQLRAWQEQRTAATEAAAQLALSERQLSADIYSETCAASELGAVVSAAGLTAIVLPRPPDASSHASEQWWELLSALRELTLPVLIV